MSIENLPALNATLNSLAAFCLVFGFIAIKKGYKEIHKRFMVSAFIISTFFLISYLFYHYHMGSKVFPDLGWIRIIYLIILFTHVILAIVMVPLILLTFFRAHKKNWDGHKKIAKITFPIWTYVSVTGVIIYLMLYQIFVIKVS